VDSETVGGQRKLRPECHELEGVQVVEGITRPAWLEILTNPPQRLFAGRDLVITVSESGLRLKVTVEAGSGAIPAQGSRMGASISAAMVGKNAPQYLRPIRRVRIAREHKNP